MGHAGNHRTPLQARNLVGSRRAAFALVTTFRTHAHRHAAQSVVVFAALYLLIVVLGDFMLGSLLPHAVPTLLIQQRVVKLVWIVAALALKLKANAGDRFRVPIACTQRRGVSVFLFALAAWIAVRPWIPHRGCHCADTPGEAMVSRLG